MAARRAVVRGGARGAPVARGSAASGVMPQAAAGNPGHLQRSVERRRDRSARARLAAPIAALSQGRGTALATDTCPRRRTAADPARARGVDGAPPRAWKQRLEAELRRLPELDEMRLWIEEYRVSLYAQELKTLGPVSAARACSSAPRRSPRGSRAEPRGAGYAPSLQIETNSLRERQLRAPVDGGGLAAHVRFPGIGARFAAAARCPSRRRRHRRSRRRTCPD